MLGLAQKMMSKECKNCIWFDKCGQEDVCESYEPSSTEEEESANAAAYEDDLKNRHTLYKRQIFEQNR